MVLYPPPICNTSTMADCKNKQIKKLNYPTEDDASVWDRQQGQAAAEQSLKCNDSQNTSGKVACLIDVQHSLKID